MRDDGFMFLVVVIVRGCFLGREKVHRKYTNSKVGHNFEKRWCSPSSKENNWDAFAQGADRLPYVDFRMYQGALLALLHRK